MCTQQRRVHGENICACASLTSGAAIGKNYIARDRRLTISLPTQLMHMAAKGGDLDAVVDLAADWDFDPSHPTLGGGLTPLHLAAASGHTSIVEWLVSISFASPPPRQLSLQSLCMSKRVS